MPGPVSAIEMISKGAPASRGPSDPEVLMLGSCVLSFTSTVRVPPAFIASIALRKIFNSAWRIWAGSMLISLCPEIRFRVTLISLLTNWLLRKSSVSLINRTMSVGLGRGGAEFLQEFRVISFLGEMFSECTDCCQWILDFMGQSTG